jgi:hypothetical protein
MNRDPDQTFEVQIPFAGFYGGMHDASLDDTFAQMFTDRETGCHSAPAAIVDKARDAVCWHDVYKAYAKEYAESFLQEFDLIGEFSAMDSPKYYNFSTDRIFVTIDRPSLAKIARGARSALNAMAKRRHTSRDGFISWYDPNWKNWGPVSSWDHNQLGTLLLAYLETEKGDWDIWAEFDLMESAQGNGRFDNWIWENADPMLARMANLWDYLQDRCEREVRTMAQYVAKRRAMNLPFADTPLGAYL